MSILYSCPTKPANWAATKRPLMTNLRTEAHNTPQQPICGRSLTRLHGALPDRCGSVFKLSAIPSSSREKAQLVGVVTSGASSITNGKLLSIWPCKCTANSFYKAVPGVD